MEDSKATPATASLATRPKGDVREALEALEVGSDLICEAKGYDGPNGGFVTDHLDAAESWIAKVHEYLTALTQAPRSCCAEERERCAKIADAAIKTAAIADPQSVASPGDCAAVACTAIRSNTMPKTDDDGRCPECGEDEVDGARCYYCGFHDYDCEMPDCKWCAERGQGHD